MATNNKLIERFREIDSSVNQNLADDNSPLKLGLAVLTISKNNFGVEYLSLKEISEALDRMGISVNRLSISRAFSRAGNKVRSKREDNVKKYKVMILGQRLIENLITIGGLEIYHVQKGKPRTTRKKLSELLKTLKGIIRICDPYYGIKTLDVLEMFSKNTNVKFLTARTNERPRRLSNAVSDFKTEYSNVEIRKYPNPSELHDRYIISSNNLIIIGHGIKDIGGKESFIFQFEKNMVKDLMDTLTKHFDNKWENAIQI